MLSGKFVYVVMTAQYTGQRRTLTEMERFCGLLPQNCTPEACEKMRRTASYLAECSKGFAPRQRQEPPTSTCTPREKSSPLSSTTISKTYQEESLCPPSPTFMTPSTGSRVYGHHGF